MAGANYQVSHRIPVLVYTTQNIPFNMYTIILNITNSMLKYRQFYQIHFITVLKNAKLKIICKFHCKKYGI